jgi:hypothetical protein
LISARAQRDALATLRSPIRTTVWAPGTYTEERREPEERGPLKGTRLHDAKWVGLRIVARHTDESFESSFRRVTSHVCLAHPPRGLAVARSSEVEPRPDRVWRVACERNAPTATPSRGDTSRHARAAGARIGTNKNRRCACVRRAADRSSPRRAPVITIVQASAPIPRLRTCKPFKSKHGAELRTAVRTASATLRRVPRKELGTAN